MKGIGERNNMEELKKTRLGDILNFRRGHDLPKSQMIDGSIPVAGSNGIIGYHNTPTPISPCITIGRSGSIGIPYIYDKCWAHNTVLYVDDFKGNDPEYLYYLLKTLPLSSFTGGSAVPTLNRNHIHPMEVKCHTNITVQRKVVNILKSLDDKIELNNRINANLEEQAQALFRRWFVDFEFPNEQGLPYKSNGGKFIDSELGRIPKEWKVGTLSDIANIIMGQSPSGESYNENGEGKVFYQGRTDFGNRFPSRRLFTTEPKRMAEEKSVLLSVRAPVGDINIAIEKCCIGRGLASIRAKNDFYSFLLYTMFNLKDKLNLFNGEGTVFGSINKTSLESIHIVKPNLQTVQSFEFLINDFDRQIKRNYYEIVSLEQLRDVLLPKLMNNEIKL